MFGLSPTEILIILAVALIFVGPDQLPKVARQIGKGVRDVRSAMGKVDDEMRRAVREAAAEFNDDGEPVVDPPKPRAPAAIDAPPGEPDVAAIAASADPVGEPAPEPTTPEPTTANAQPQARDWSQVGKVPVTGAVAQQTKSASVVAARPTELVEAPAAVATVAAPDPEAAKT